MRIRRFNAQSHRLYSQLLKDGRHVSTYLSHYRALKYKYFKYRCKLFTLGRIDIYMEYIFTSSMQF
jgi:hypothetical protein